MKLSILAALLAVMLVASACVPIAPTQSAPPPQPTAVPAESTKAPEPMAKDIVDTAVANGSFTTLVAAVQAAGLVDTLKGVVRSPSSPPPTRPSRSCRPARSKAC